MDNYKFDERDLTNDERQRRYSRRMILLAIILWPIAIAMLIVAMLYNHFHYWGVM